MKPAGLKSLSPRAQIFLWAALAVLFACAALSLVFATHGGMREKLPAVFHQFRTAANPSTKPGPAA